MIETIVAAALLADVNGIAFPAGPSVPAWAIEAYGDQIEFDIYRKGKKIGSHSVSFSRDGDAYYVDTETLIKVKFLFITAYKLEYETREIWRDEGLVSISAKTNNNGRKSQFEMNYAENSITVSGTTGVKGEDGENVFALGQELYPTNHWHPLVLNTDTVMNTITGQPNEVDIQASDWQLVEIADGSLRRAMKYDYTGQLKDVSAWYDEQGRWVGLQFKGDDGSLITYQCVECGQ